MVGDYTFGNDYKLSEIYQPTEYKMEEDSHFLGLTNPMPAKSIAMTTDPRTANQIQALSQSLNQGASTIEICGPLGEKEFDEIPKQHFEEMMRKAKLAEADLSLHAPIMEISGRGQQGFSEDQRVATEKQLAGVMEKAIDMVDKDKPDYSMPVVIHAAAGEGSTWKYVGEGKDRKKVYDMMVAIDRQTGQAMPVKEDTKYYPMQLKDKETGKIPEIMEKTQTVYQQLDSINATKWDDEMTKVQMQLENADRIMGDIHPKVHEALMSGHQFNTAEGQQAKRKIGFANEYINEAERSVRSAFSRAYELARDRDTDESRERLEALNKISEIYSSTLGIKDGSPTEMSQSPLVRAEATRVLTNSLREIVPEQFVTMEDFAIEKGSETLSNVALETYERAKSQGKTAPTIAVENLFQGMGFSQAEDLNNLIEETQKKFVDKAVNSGIMSQNDAERQAGDMIGVTFDVGHLNLSRKHGFRDEEIAAEAKEFAKHVKHLHITDNFGYSDSHLPIGMGNVPMKAIYEAIEEVQGEDAAAKMKKVQEVGGWFKNFQSSPFPQLLEAAGSPIYSTGSGPMWDTRGGFQQSYMEGYGMMLPDTHMQLYGAGFSNLPAELGGSVGQGGGRMGGGF